jgi:CRP/FNR family transcriptional regulator
MFDDPSLETLTKLRSFFETSVLLRFKKKDLILHFQEAYLSVFCLKKGYLRVFSISDQGEELTLTILKPGDFFPLTYGMGTMSNPYYLEAITNLELWKVSQANFRSFVKDNPDVLHVLASRIMVKFDAALLRIENLIFNNAYIKVATILLICAKKFGVKEGGDIILQVPLTHKDISTFVGITRETTSVEIKKLQNKGFLSKRRGFILIKNAEQLEEEILFLTQEEKSALYHSF